MAILFMLKLSMIDRLDEFKELELKWAQFQPTFEHNFLKEISMCKPSAIINNKSVAFEFTVLPEMCSIFKTLHRGSAATIMDTLMSWSIVAEPGQSHPFHVTTDLDLNYLNAISVGEKVLLKAKLVGQNAAGVVVVEGQLIRVSDGLICVDAKQAMMRVDGSLIRGKSDGKMEKQVDRQVVKLYEPETDLRTLRFQKQWQRSHSPDLFTKYLIMWKLIYAKPGANLFEIRVTKAATNVLGIVHGGFIAAAMDAGICLTAIADKNLYRVSVALHISYLAQGFIGDVLQLRTTTIFETDDHATIYATITNKLTKVKIASGYQTVVDITPPAHVLERFEAVKPHI